MITQIWGDCLQKGKIKEQIFKEDFCNYLNIGLLDVTDNQEYRSKDIDFVLHCLSFIDVKPYNDYGYVSIEEMSVVENNRSGWVETSGAKYYAFVSTKTRTILILRNDEDFKWWWQHNKNNYNLITQQTVRDQRSWHSQHRNIPLIDLNIAWYKKNHNYK